MGCGKIYPRRIFLRSKVCRVVAGGNRSVAISSDGYAFTWEGDRKESVMEINLTNVISATVAPGGNFVVLLCRSEEAWEWRPGGQLESWENWELQRVKQVSLSRVHTAALVESKYFLSS